MVLHPSSSMSGRCLLSTLCRTPYSCGYGCSQTSLMAGNVIRKFSKLSFCWLSKRPAIIVSSLLHFKVMHYHLILGSLACILFHFLPTCQDNLNGISMDTCNLTWPISYLSTLPSFHTTYLAQASQAHNASQAICCLFNHLSSPTCMRCLHIMQIRPKA